jgi:hypothetical protein
MSPQVQTINQGYVHTLTPSLSSFTYTRILIRLVKLLATHYYHRMWRNVIYYEYKEKASKKRAKIDFKAKEKSINKQGFTFSQWLSPFPLLQHSESWPHHSQTKAPLLRVLPPGLFGFHPVQRRLLWLQPTIQKT